MSTFDNIYTGNGTPRNVGDPNARYQSLKETYRRNRACLSGERYVKDYDRSVGVKNILIPFSPNMTQGQYDWFKCEAEYPGLVETYSRVIVGALLRKLPQFELPEDKLTEEQMEEATNWLYNNFAQDNGSMTSFLDRALWEELQTSRAWVCVNYPVTNPDDFTPEELQPYPILLAGESIINWETNINARTNKLEVTRLIIRMFRERPSVESQYHTDQIDTVWVHELDESGYYQILIYEKNDSTAASTPVRGGRIDQDYAQYSADTWQLVETETNILRAGERLDYIPIFPLNGDIEPRDPFLSNMINREIGLYNRISRRNHVLYGSAAYTPVVFSDQLGEDEQDAIVSSGLGSWIFLDAAAKTDVLQVPVDSLEYLERAIENTINDLAHMGLRILTPEGTGGSAASGIALEIRNAPQTAQLSNLASKISQQLASIIATMINWRYGLVGDQAIEAHELRFMLSQDLNPAPLGVDWLRLVAEWYQGGIIDKGTFIQMAKQNDILPPDYNDEEAQAEIESDPLVITPREREAMDRESMEMQLNARNN